MNEEQSAGDRSERMLVDYALLLWRYKWFISGLCVMTIMGTFVVTIRTPRVYESTATLLAPREGAGASGLVGGLLATGLLQNVPTVVVPSLTPNRDMLTSILKSRTMAETLVERFRLRDRYEAKFLEDAIASLQAATTVSASSREGVISVKVAETDPHLAAAMANFYVDQVDRFVSRFGSGEAAHQRSFLTKQLARARGDLETAEGALRHFQERNQASVLQEQTRGAIEAAARLKGEIMAADVQLEVMRNFATDANPEVIALRRRIGEMNRQLAQMQYGDGVARLRPQAAGRNQHDFSLPFARLPEVGLELARLTRDVKVQETMANLLSQQLEQARLVEARDLPTVQILDRAVAAGRHSRPVLRSNLMLAGIVSLVASILLAFLLDRVRQLSLAPKRA